MKRILRALFKTPRRAALSIVIIAMVLLIAAVLVLRRDLGAPDDSDMQFVRRQPAVEDNGFLDLEESVTELPLEAGAYEMVARASFETPEEAEAMAEDLSADGEWDHARVGEFLATCEDDFARLDRCLARADFVLPEAADLNTPLDYLMSFRDVAVLLELRALWRLREGDTDGSIEDGLRIVRLGQRIEDGQGILVTLLIGLSTKGIGVGWIDFVARHGSPSRDRCIEVARELAQSEVRKEAVQTAVREEYRMFTEFLDDSAFDVGVQRWLIQPNRTRRLFLASFRRIIDALEKPLRGSSAKADPVGKSWLNYGGETIHAQVVDAIVRTTEECYRSRFVIRATRVLLALRAYHVDHGRLPADLAALVPTFLDAVPRDPWDGEPLRYSAAKRQIWAVGDDLVDDGGSEEEDRGNALSDETEPTLRWKEWSER